MARRQRETERAQAINQQIRARMDLYKRVCLNPYDLMLRHTFHFALLLVFARCDSLPYSYIACLS